MIIDQLLVALGFKVDPKGIKEFEKKAFDVKQAMIGIGSAIAVAGIGKWIGDTVGRLADVQKLSTVLQLPAKSIAALGKVAVENEGSVEGMNETLETLTRTTGQAALGIGRGAMIFKKLGLHAKDSAGHVKDFTTILGDVADLMKGKSRTEQLGIATRLGIDEHLLDILGQGREKILALTAAAEKANPLSNKDYENALVTEKMFVKTKASITAVSNQIAVKLLPVIDQALTGIIAWFNEARHSEAFANLIAMVINFARDLGVVVGAVMSVIGVLAKWGPSATAIKVILGAMVAMKVAGWLNGIASAATAAVGALVKFLTTAKGLQTLLGGALIVAIGLVIEDLWQFYHGGLSVTGMLVNKWRPALLLIKAALGGLIGSFILLKSSIARQLLIKAIIPKAWQSNVSGFIFRMVKLTAVTVAGWIKMGAVAAANGIRMAAAWAMSVAPITATIGLFVAAAAAGFAFGGLLEHLITRLQVVRDLLGLDAKEGAALKNFKSPEHFDRSGATGDDTDTSFLQKRVPGTGKSARAFAAAHHASSVGAVPHHAVRGGIALDDARHPNPPHDPEARSQGQQSRRARARARRARALQEPERHSQRARQDGALMGKDTPRVWILADGTAVSFDASIREMHSSDLTITDEPVETGVVISDHAFVMPAVYEMDGQVSSAQMHTGNEDPFGPQSDPFGSGDDRPSAAWIYLKNIQASATPFTIQTGLQVYTNMVLKSISAVQDKDSSSALAFHAILREVQQVSTQTVSFPPRKPKKPSRTASPKVNNGEQSTTPVTEPQQASLALTALFGNNLTPDQIKAASAPMAAAQAGP